LDALPIQEENLFSHRSKTDNISHKCGHDGHMVILIGLAKWLKHNPNPKGVIYLLFQPAEETGEGAESILKQPYFNDLHLDYVFALHNLPGYPKHSIIVREDNFNASVKSIIISLKGKTSHASEPEHGINPSIAIAQLLIAFSNFSQPDTNRLDFKLITPVHVNIGKKAYGVSAGSGEIHLTVRSWSEPQMKLLTDSIKEEVERIAGENHLLYSFEYLQSFASNFNSKDAVNYVEHAAKDLELHLFKPKTPFKWGEDFGLFTKKYKGCMFGLGAGENMPALHNPDYDFPNEIIDTGLKMFGQIINQIYK
jgi:amidohydrolase